MNKLDNQLLNILVSSIPLPAVNIGSWTNRIGQFQSKNQFFDHILSPTSAPNDQYIFCQKKEVKPFHKIFKNRVDRLAIEFLEALRKLSQQGQALRILVVDDRSLLEAVANSKSDFPMGTELIYSHHGDRLTSAPHVFEKVDKVLFLTEIGYKKTIEASYQFTPEVFIVGNGVVGDNFHPTDNEERTRALKEFGWSDDDIVLTWLANSRPVKGLHIFKKIVQRLSQKYSNIKVISIGHKPFEESSNGNWKQVGVVPNSELPRYLQLGDAYFFTSLWQEGFGLSLAEAVKCGNTPITSSLGGIKEVLKDIPDAIFVDQPNLVEKWEEAFEEFLSKRAKVKKLSKMELSNWQTYEGWEARFLNALES